MQLRLQSPRYRNWPCQANLDPALTVLYSFSGIASSDASLVHAGITWSPQIVLRWLAIPSTARHHCIEAVMKTRRGSVRETLSSPTFLFVDLKTSDFYSARFEAVKRVPTHLRRWRVGDHGRTRGDTPFIFGAVQSDVRELRKRLIGKFSISLSLEQS